MKYHHLVGGGGRISTSKPTWSLHKYYTHKHAFTCYIHVTRWYGLSVSYHMWYSSGLLPHQDAFERELTISSANATLWLPFFKWFILRSQLDLSATEHPEKHMKTEVLVCLQIPTIYIAHQRVTQILAKWPSDLHAYALACVHFPTSTHIIHTQ